MNLAHRDILGVEHICKSISVGLPSLSMVLLVY